MKRTLAKILSFALVLAMVLSMVPAVLAAPATTTGNPQYLALVIIKEPEGMYYGSTVAAPYAKRVFEGIIDLKNIPKAEN